jgi:hypothetical protein
MNEYMVGLKNCLILFEMSQLKEEDVRKEMMVLKKGMMELRKYMM